jgi:hypothetical protein
MEETGEEMGPTRHSTLHDNLGEHKGATHIRIRDEKSF